MHRKLFYFSILSTCVVAFGILLIAFIYQPSVTGQSFNANAFPPATKEFKVYTDQLADGWVDGSWNTAIVYTDTAQVHTGTAAIAVTYQAQWASIYVISNQSVPADEYDLLRFWVHGGSSGGQSLKVVLSEAGVGFSTEAVIIPVEANQWQQVDIPLSKLGNMLNIEGIAWQENGQGAQPTMYIDDVSFVDLELPPTATPVPVSGPSLSVDVDAERHLISEDIYGINFSGETLAETIALPVDRWGGNAARATTGSSTPPTVLPTGTLKTSPMPTLSPTSCPKAPR
ncbi:MAG: hypothetical protein R2911_40445 [Caldilineaceae bacterium]